MESFFERRREEEQDHILLTAHDCLSEVLNFILTIKYLLVSL
jgi:hypothetical protein